jgi:hypothetical protein
MKKYISAGAFLLSVFVLAPAAMAQCPAGLANPLYLLDGTNWAFQASENFNGEGLVGTFKATVKPPAGTNPFYTGVLAITETENTSGSVNRLLTATGKYQIYPDCTGGELLFNVNGHVFQFEFVFVNGRTEMYFVSDSQSGSNVGIGQLSGEHGTAILTPSGCPAGVVDPLTLLAGTWTFHAEDAASGSAGMFTAQIKNGLGFLTVIETTTNFGIFTPAVLRDQQFTGKYQVYPDCSGGELLFNVGLNAVQYEFVFVDGGAEIFMLSDSATPLSITSPVLRGNSGKAKKI